MKTRLGTFVTSGVVLALMSVAPDASGQVAGLFPRGEQGIRRVAAALNGSVEGLVIDDSGAPVQGATVSALGATSAVAISDATGRFHFEALPPGPYLVRAHFSGYIPSRRQFVEVRASACATLAVSLRRADRTHVLAAGLAPAPAADAGEANEDHGEVAWRLRHVQRSPLKDVADGVVLVPVDDQTGDKHAGFARASARFASSLFDDLPFIGQVNLLTAGSFDGVDGLFSSDVLSNSVAAVSLRGPVAGVGDWAVEGITSQGDLGSWFLSGSFRSRAPASHVYDINVSYTAQRLSSASSSLTDASRTLGPEARTVGSVYAVDRWQVSPQIGLTYAVRYSRYDYLGDDELSPRAELTLKPARTVRLRASASRHVLAPGAEEFLPPLAPGLWVPSERTFDWLSTQSLRAERANTYEFQVEHDLGEGYVVSARVFYQEVQNQLAALFGPADGATTATARSRYQVGMVGDVDAQGWSVAISTSAHKRVRGSIGYQMTTASWRNTGEGALMAAAAPSLLRQPSEVLHDVTTSVDTELPVTSTRVFVIYKIDTRFVGRRAGFDTTPGLDGRFDVQVTQPLPLLDFTSAQWQVVFAVRNLFRETSPTGSVYDELLVVHPPKRMVGGLVVRF
jgi:outer membrane receptor protein involved in Fe transport